LNGFPTLLGKILAKPRFLLGRALIFLAGVIAFFKTVKFARVELAKVVVFSGALGVLLAFGGADKRLGHINAKSLAVFSGGYFMRRPDVMTKTTYEITTDFTLEGA